MLSESKVAILHESFARYSPAALAMEEIVKMLPHADLLSITAAGKDLPQYIQPRLTKAAWLNYLPAKDRLYRQYFFLHPLAIRSIDLSRYKVLISNCMGFAKGAIRSDDAAHICYCHAPTQWIWRFREYARAEKINPIAGMALRPILAGLRQVDVHSSVQPDYYIAASQVAAVRIKECYDRNSVVVHPPIDLSGFHAAAETGNYFLVVSPLLPHKRIDMIIAACNSSGKRLIVVGEGPDRARLEAMAGPTIELLGEREEAEAAELMSRCQAVFCLDDESYLDPAPLQANACGRPSITLAAGSALETVVDGITGVQYSENSRPSIVNAIERCCDLKWDPALLCAYSREFGAPAFREKFTAALKDILGTQAVAEAMAVA